MIRALLRSAISVVIAAVLAGGAVAQTPDTRPGVAVMPFFAGYTQGDDQNFARLSIGLQQILITELQMNPAIRVVDRSVIRDLLAEQDLGTSGRIDDHTAARVGRIVGAKYFVTGGFNEVGGVLQLDGRIVNVETSELLKAERVSGPVANIYRIATDFGNRITSGANLPPLSREQRQQQDERASAVPVEALVLYSMATQSLDEGRTDEGIELLRRVTREFPQFTLAREELKQAGGG
jgi:TolB-like protein